MSNRVFKFRKKESIKFRKNRNITKHLLCMKRKSDFSCREEKISVILGRLVKTAKRPIIKIADRYDTVRSLLNCVCWELKTCSHVTVTCVFTCSRANVPCALTCSRANMSRALMCSRANVSCVFTCSCANVSCMITCSRARCLASLRAYVPTCLEWLCDSPVKMLCVLMYSYLNMACKLTRSRGKMPWFPFLTRLVWPRDY